MVWGAVGQIKKNFDDSTYRDVRILESLNFLIWPTASKVTGREGPCHTTSFYSAKVCRLKSALRNFNLLIFRHSVTVQFNFISQKLWSIYNMLPIYKSFPSELVTCGLDQIWKCYHFVSLCFYKVD